MVIIAQEISKVTIYVNKEVRDVIKAKQMDANSRFLEITLVHDNGTPVDLTGHLVRFNALKADGSHIFNNCEITDAPGGIFLLELTDQALALGDSTIIADISVHTNDEKAILTTRTFTISVQAMLRDNDAVESSDEYHAVITIFQDIWDIREVIRNINERFGGLGDDLADGQEQAGSSALGAHNNIWNYLKTQSVASVAETVSGIIEMINDLKDSVGGSGANTVLGLLELLKSRGAVKSVQRGTTSAGSVNISSVDPKKCLVIINNSLNATGKTYAYNYDTNGAHLSSISATSISFGRNYTYGSMGGNPVDNPYTSTYYAFSWQVIEFY